MTPPEPSKAERTKERIRDAAAVLFASRSFESVSTRAIAKQAGVDAALIHHYFTSKEGLFQAVMDNGIQAGHAATRVLTFPVERWGTELARAMEQVWTSPAAPALKAVVRRALASSHSPLEGYATRMILGPLAQQLGLPEDEARLRAALVGSQLVGMVVARHIVGIEPLASLTSAEVIDLLAPTLQRHLTGEL
ncbi:TetR/AcrR family transcriptional regulator [Arachnia propionica]|uniref:TetR/AcrR family transcriptional regulator n=1 Tax=Arachnia propionica TaxID=1750 RepID=A0A3P1T2E5_9ACTN|nr:TetR family transcriptional regulator [Arachnia propionica]RRD03500.1 TetR/AcrR family transcriptional regulator [Arachnia propionica]